MLQASACLPAWEDTKAWVEHGLINDQDDQDFPMWDYQALVLGLRGRKRECRVSGLLLPTYSLYCSCL